MIERTVVVASVNQLAIRFDCSICSGKVVTTKLGVETSVIQTRVWAVREVVRVREQGLMSADGTIPWIVDDVKVVQVVILAVDAFRFQDQVRVLEEVLRHDQTRDTTHDGAAVVVAGCSESPGEFFVIVTSQPDHCLWKRLTDCVVMHFQLTTA